MLNNRQDAFGHGMVDYLNGKSGVEIVERDDGLIEPNGGPAVYFVPYKKWHPLEKKAVRYARGRVLDVGCGAGRHTLYLQEKGFTVVAIDNSPLAVEVCRKRGVEDARVLSVFDISSALGIFDTIWLLDNFSLFGNPERSRRLLKRLYKITSAKGRILASSADPCAGDDPDHLAYHAANRAKGKMPGQLRIRVRYKRFATPWIQFLLVSKQELESILEGTGWRVEKYVDARTPQYLAILSKKNL